jgi:Protein of unknown function (DUF3987)/Bifunctional DNA primase/polymerase, N-terminal
MDNTRDNDERKRGNPILEAALEYRRRGWAVAVLRGKAATETGWQNVQHSEADLVRIFANKKSNVGIRTGEVSGGLADVDLDCPEARALASTFLPPTPAKFGRKSTPRSHWFYRSTSPSFKAERLADPEYVKPEQPNPNDHKGAIVELRGDNSQTMAPPSIHPDCGEQVTWNVDFSSIEPASVDYEVLRTAVYKLAAAALLARRWPKLLRHDFSMALAGALLQAGLAPDEVLAFVLAVAEEGGDEEFADRQRAVEDTIKKFNAGEPVAGITKCQELLGEKTWAKIAEWMKLRGSNTSDQFEPFDPTIVHTHQHATPQLPVEVFGPHWAWWLQEQAILKGAPIDFVAAALLPAGAALIGNARAATPWDGWVEPPILWLARVGNPSSGKSPAAEEINDMLRKLEAELGENRIEENRQFEQEVARAKAERAAWDAQLKEALKKVAPVPDLPVSALPPKRRGAQRLIVSDTTMEALGDNLASSPKGLILVRDELGGWLEGFGRYAAGSKNGERGFWIEGFGGRPYTFDRVRYEGTPRSIERVTVSIAGGLQPDKLASLFLDGDDDGLASRFLYVFPDPPPVTRPIAECTISPALDALRRLRNLSMEPRRVLCLTADAANRFQAWRETHAPRVHKSSGMFQGWLGKLPGIVLRLALVLRYLRWCSEDGFPKEPTDIDLGTTCDAIRLVDGYFVPMALRVFGDAAVPEPERDAVAITRLITSREIGTEQAGRYVINLRKDVQRRGINRIRTASHARQALDELRDAGWVRPLRSATGGRPRGDYEVNPKALLVKAPKAQRAASAPTGEPWRAWKPN